MKASEGKKVSFQNCFLFLLFNSSSSSLDWTWTLWIL